jgi:hypothetical protein
LTLRGSWRLDGIEDLANSIVRHILKDSDPGLLAGIQQRIDVRKKLFLIQLKLRVCEIEIVHEALQFVVGGIARDCLTYLIQRASTALADFKSIAYELLKERKDLGEHLVGDFAGLHGLLKLTDVKAQHGIFDDGAARRAVRPQLLLRLLLTFLPAQRTAVRSRDDGDQQSAYNNPFHRL